MCIALRGSGTQVTRELETQVLITALALPYGGRILFAATEMGVVRCYKYPLTGGPGRVTPGDRRCLGFKRACRQQLRQQTPSHLLTWHTGSPNELLLLLTPTSPMQGSFTRSSATRAPSPDCTSATTTACW